MEINKYYSCSPDAAIIPVSLKCEIAHTQLRVFLLSDLSNCFDFIVVHSDISAV